MRQTPSFTARVSCYLGYKWPFRWAARFPFGRITIFPDLINFGAAPFSTTLPFREIEMVLIRKKKKRGLLKSMWPGWSFLYQVQFVHHSHSCPFIIVSFIGEEFYKEVLRILKFKGIKIKEES